MNRYRKGYIWELEVKKQWEARGWTVFRCASSKPVDLIALRPRSVPRVIECKVGSPPSRSYQEQKVHKFAKLDVIYVIETKKDVRKTEELISADLAGNLKSGN